MFSPDIFLASLIFDSKARAHPSGFKLSKLAPGLTNKYWTSLKKFAGTKHSSFFKSALMTKEKVATLTTGCLDRATGNSLKAFLSLSV